MANDQFDLLALQEVARRDVAGVIVVMTPYRSNYRLIYDR